MDIYVKFAFVFFVILAVYQLGRIFTSKKESKIKYGYLIFMVPLILGIYVNPQGLNADAAENKGIYVNGENHFDHEHIHNAVKVNYLDKDEIILNEKNFLDVINELNTHTEECKGKKVEFSGFILKEKNLDKSEFLVGRMILSCCAADAQGIAILCQHDNIQNLKQDQWVKIKGIVDTTKDKKGGRMLVIKVESIETIDIPVNKYLYE
jgi:putative membrane protein